MRSGTRSARSSPGRSPITSSGRRTAWSTAASGSRPARPGCSASTCRGVRRRRGHDFRYNAVLVEEMPRGRHGLGFSVHNDIIGPYLHRLANDEQKQRWLPGFCSGELITAIAMSEPGAGSDLQGIQTTAVDDGDDCAQRVEDVHHQRHLRRPGDRRGEDRPGRGRTTGISLLVVERGMAGLRARPQPRQDRPARPGHRRAVLHRRRVPAANLLGEEGYGLHRPDENLPQERLSIADRRAGRGRRRCSSSRWSTARTGRRSAARSAVPAQPLRAGRDGHRGP